MEKNPNSEIYHAYGSRLASRTKYVKKDINGIQKEKALDSIKNEFEKSYKSNTNRDDLNKRLADIANKYGIVLDNKTRDNMLSEANRYITSVVKGGRKTDDQIGSEIREKSSGKKSIGGMVRFDQRERRAGIDRNARENVIFDKIELYGESPTPGGWNASKKEIEAYKKDMHKVSFSKSLDLFLNDVYDWEPYLNRFLDLVIKKGYSVTDLDKTQTYKDFTKDISGKATRYIQDRLTQYGYAPDKLYPSEQSEFLYKVVETAKKKLGPMIRQRLSVKHSGVYRYHSLQHSGILGMRWGRRRYQYEDGTLTPEGRRRYGRGERRNSRFNSNQNSAEDIRNSKRSMIQEMTDDEVRDASNRIGMENDLLSKEVQNNKLIGEASVTKLMDTLKDIKDVTGLIRGITTDISGSVSDITNISINNAKRSDPFRAAFPKGDKKDDDDEKKKKSSYSSSTSTT